MIKYLLLFSFFLLKALHSYPQKATIDSSTFGKWPSLSEADVSTKISNDGHYILYTINNVPLGNNTLVIQSTDNEWKMSFPNVDRGFISTDSKRALFKTKSDSLCIVILGTTEKTYLSNVQSFQLAKGGVGVWLAYYIQKPTGDLFLQNLTSNSSGKLHFSFVTDYLLSDQGKVLLIQSKEITDSGNIYSLQWIDLQSGEKRIIWRGQKTFNYEFDARNEQLAFISEEKKGNHKRNIIWYYNLNMKEVMNIVSDTSIGIDSNLTVGRGPLIFSSKADMLFFYLSERALPQALPGTVKLDIWSYNDKRLQSDQLYNTTTPQEFTSVFNFPKHRIIQLEKEDETVLKDVKEITGDYVLLWKNLVHSEFWHNKASLPAIYLVSLQDGSRELLKAGITSYPSLYFDFPSSPHDKWYVYFDNDRKTYYSYELTSGFRRDITKNISLSLTNSECIDQGKDQTVLPVGIAAWLANDSAVLIYDDYDIWCVDPSARKIPVNITRGYGRTHHIKFRLLPNDVERANGLLKKTKILLSAFDSVNKFNGFYSVVWDSHMDPELLTMGPYIYCLDGSQVGPFSLDGAGAYFRPIKAKNADIWIVQRMSATETPNFFVTRNFKTYHPLSDIHPENSYIWLRSELVRWTMNDGKESQGILFKPENFDSTRKYPLIITYYEKKSDGLYAYLEPATTGAAINIPYFVSRGYLVFEPDIHYSLGHPGKSVVNAVVSSAKYLSRMPWVNGKKIGINGHSFGGYETNYLVTHTHIFAAAAEAAGVSDMIGFYGGLTGGEVGGAYYYEIGQGRIGTSLWERPELYIENSPIFQANKVTTPLLMMNNKGDAAVRFEQGVEFFTALRRLGKKAWMLQYDKGWHGVGGKDAMDYTIRLTQFFDHYLKDAPPPKWMTEGIPARLKGIETGYELDTSGKQP
jgi:dienelactone hydrolase